MYGDNFRVAVITGASSGIGLCTAKALAAKGFRIIGTGRNPERMARAEAEIRAAAAPGVPVEMLRADLSLISGAVQLADEILERTERIDVLLNNAGGTSNGQAITAEGYEATFTGNHLGQFVLTERLLPRLRKAASSGTPGATRIVNVSSSAHEFAPGFDWDDIQMMQGFIPIKAYCNAKLANVLHARKLAQKLNGSGIVVHSMHPGAVDTNFINYADPATQEHLRTNGMISVEEGADTLIWLATASTPGNSTGQYWDQRAAVATGPLDTAESAERLWAESEKLAKAALEAREQAEA
jgi:NAD(P)-dependent dehydrogenase (short-subunit alcohol dehydrogenase family)